jgi:hypothetical protein
VREVGVAVRVVVVVARVAGIAVRASLLATLTNLVSPVQHVADVRPQRRHATGRQSAGANGRALRVAVLSAVLSCERWHDARAACACRAPAS